MRASAATERPVDLIVGRYRWQQRAVARAQALPGGQRVVLARDLVLLKLYAAVEEDLPDLPPPAAVLWSAAKSPASRDP